MNNKYLKFILGAFIVIGVLILIFKNNDAININVDTSALRLEETNSFSNDLDVYLVNNSGNEDYDICFTKKENCDKKLLSFKVESDDAYLLDNYKHLYFYYIDNNKVKMYNAEEKKSYVIDKMSPDYYLDFIIDDNDEFIGVLYSTDLNERCSLLLIKGNKVIYDKKYDSLISVSPKYLSAVNYDSNGNQTGAYLVNAKKEEKPIMKKETNSDEYYGYYKLGNKYITYEYKNIIEVYDNQTLELIYKTQNANTYDSNDNVRYLLNVDFSDNILVYEDNYLYMYNAKGDLVKKSSKEINGFDLIDKYIISNNNDILTITDIDNNTIKIGSLKNGEVESYEYFEEGNRVGIYFIVSDSKVKFKDVYNSCKKTTCKDISKNDLKNREDFSYGYEYFYNYKTKKVTSTPIFINNGAR